MRMCSRAEALYYLTRCGRTAFARLPYLFSVLVMFFLAEQSRKSASKTGSSGARVESALINKVAVCATLGARVESALSRIVGIPSGLSFPFTFGMYTRRTACGLMRFQLLRQMRFQLLRQ